MATKAVIFYTRGDPNGHTFSNADIGINVDAVNGATEQSSIVLADGNTDSALAFSSGSWPFSITFDAAAQTYFYADLEKSNNDAVIRSGSTLTGHVGPVLHSALTADQVTAGFASSINGLWDDQINHKIYFTQQVLDGSNVVVPADTGLYVMNETGTGVTRLVAGLADPNVLSLDLAHNLVFFTDTNGLSDGGGSATAVNNVDVANLTTGAVTALFSEPFVDDPVFPGYDGGKIPNGIAVDPASHTLYYSTNNSFNPPANDGIFKASYTVTGSGSTASASLGASTTLYSGANSFSPTTLSVDGPDGALYVVGTVKTKDASGPGYSPTDQGVFEGSLTADNTTALTRVTPSSETPSGTVSAAMADVAPVLIAGSSVSWAAGGGPVVADAGLTTNSGSSATYLNASVGIGSAQSGDVLAAVTTGTSITASFSGTTLTLSGADTSANYQSVLDSVTFNSTGADPSASGTANSRTLTYSVNDGIIASAPATSTVNIHAAPVVTAGATASFSGAGSPVAVDAALTLADSGSTTLAGATISVIAGLLSGDTLGFGTQNGITGSYDASTGVLALSGTASLANYQAAIRSVTFGFTPTDGDPTAGNDTSRTVSYSVTDGTATSAVATSTVDVIHAAPSITAGASASFVRGGTAVAADPAASVAAPDSNGTIASATIAITANRDNADTLFFSNANGITGSFDSNAGILTLSGLSTTQAYQAAIESVIFSTGNAAATGTRTLTYTVSDGTATSASAASTLLVSQPTPSIAGTVAAQPVSDIATATPFSAVTIADSNGQQDSATITLTAGGAATDADGLLSGTGLTHTGAGLYTLASATPASLTTALEGLVFTPTAHQVAPGSTMTTNFALAVADTGGGSAADSTTSVVATAATDTPTITGTAAGQTTTDLGAVQPFSGVTIADPDFGVTPTVTITLRSGGSATDADGALSGTGLSKTGVGTYTLTDTPATLTSELRALSFAPTHDQVAAGQSVDTEFDVLAAVGAFSASDSSTTVNATDVACFCPGTLILTDRGDIPVEALGIGDVVVTASGAHRRIKWVGRRSYLRRFAARNPAVAPVRLRAGSLGGGLPRRDLLVSPKHAMFLDGALVPAEELVNGVTIVAERTRGDVHYVHIELDTHDVLLAEGAPAESFVDDDSRGMFHNAAEHDARYPNTRWTPALYCAPRLTGGYALGAIRERLARQAIGVDAGFGTQGAA